MDPGRPHLPPPPPVPSRTQLIEVYLGEGEKPARDPDFEGPDGHGISVLWWEDFA